jgi:hypothetical protein
MARGTRPTPNEFLAQTFQPGPGPAKACGYLGALAAWQEIFGAPDLSLVGVFLKQAPGNSQANGFLVSRGLYRESPHWGRLQSRPYKKYSLARF